MPGVASVSARSPIRRRSPPKSSALRGVRAIILDFDGTLASAHYDFDAMRRRVLALGARYGVPRRTIERMGVLETVQHIQSLLGRDGKRFRAEAEHAMREIELEGAESARVIPRALPALARLNKAGFRIGVITRNCSEVVEKILRGRELPCDCLLTRQNVNRVKPHPEHIRKALSLLGCPAKRAIMVGDHPMDMQAGKRAGVRTVGVLTGAGSRRQLLDSGADLVVRSVSSLARLLLEQRSRGPE
jgi:phosphoglycolate phosphatase